MARDFRCHLFSFACCLVLSAFAPIYRVLICLIALGIHWKGDAIIQMGIYVVPRELERGSLLKSWLIVFFGMICLVHAKYLQSTSKAPLTLLRNKRFLLKILEKQNTSKFAIFLEYKNPRSFFFISCYFIFFPNERPGLCRHRPGHSLGEKIK